MVLFPRAGAVLVVPAGSSHGPQAGQGRAKRDGETGSLGGIRPSALRQADPGATEPVVSDELQSRCEGGQEGLLPRKWERLLLLLALPWVGGPSPCARGLVRGGGGRVSASPKGAPLGRVATLHWAFSWMSVPACTEDKTPHEMPILQLSSSRSQQLMDPSAGEKADKPSTSPMVPPYMKSGWRHSPGQERKTKVWEASFPGGWWWMGSRGGRKKTSGNQAQRRGVATGSLGQGGECSWAEGSRRHPRPQETLWWVLKSQSCSHLAHKS